MKSPVLFLVGPTAVGKSEIAIPIAVELNCEIISADSMQIYRSMDIGTAKPPDGVLKQVPHHLINLLDPTESFSAHDFYQRSLALIADITSRGKLPLFVGGTGFYIQTLLNGSAQIAGSTQEVRAQLINECQVLGLPHMYKRLSTIDPIRAQSIMPADQKRILRALEIYTITGARPSELPKTLSSLESLNYKPIQAGLQMDRGELYQRINDRVGQMFKSGLVREVAKLKDIQLSATAGQAVGYRELLSVFREGKDPRDPLIAQYLQAQIQMHTRHLAKRQLTWFRRDLSIKWFDSGIPEVWREVLKYYKTQIAKNSI